MTERDDDVVVGAGSAGLRGGAMSVLDDRQAELVRTLCELIVPGCARTRAEVYVDAVLAAMSDADRAEALAAFQALATSAADGVAALAEHQFSPAFALVRALACEAFYSDFVAADAPGPGAWREIDFAPPQAARLQKDWTYLGAPR